MDVGSIAGISMCVLALVMAFVEMFNMSKWLGLSVGSAALGATWGLCWVAASLGAH